MIEQGINTQVSSIGSIGESGLLSKGAKTGLFAKLMAVFQKHIKQGEAPLLQNSQSVSISGKIASLTHNKMGAETPLLIESTVNETKLHKVNLPIATQSLLVGSNTKEMDKAAYLPTKDGGFKISAKEPKSVMKEDKISGLEEYALVGLGIENSGLNLLEKTSNQKQPLQSLTKSGDQGLGLKSKGGEVFEENNISLKQGQLESKIVTKAGLSQANSISKLPVLDTSDPTIKANVLERGDTLDIRSGSIQSKGRVHLQGFEPSELKNEVIKLASSDNGMTKPNSKIVQDIMKGSPVVTKVTGDGVTNKVLTKSVSPSLYVASVEDDTIKGETSKISVSQLYSVQQERPKKSILSGENISKQQTFFQPATANKTVTINGQQNIQSQVSQVVNNDVAMQSFSGQRSNMGSDDGMGRSPAEILATDMLAKDARIPRSDFATHMAYRSSLAFKPADAMLEISKAARDGSIKIELQLEPATLGRIQVTIQTDAAKHIQVHLTVEQNASRQVLEQQLPQLRQALADQGLNLSGFTMDMSSQQQQQNESSERETASLGSVDGDMELVVMAQALSTRLGVNMADDGRLNILA